MTRIARQCDGLLLPHYAPPGMGLGRVYAQIRPDDEVFTGDVQHHGAHRNVRAWAHHLARHSDHGDLDLTDAEVDALSDEELRELASTPRMVDTPRGERELRGDRKHTHHDKGKYIHPPGPMETIDHDHAADFDGKPKLLASHIRYEHKGEDVAGLHGHRVKNRSIRYATRLDVSPLIHVQDLLAARRFYFVLEGTIKNLAVLTWVRRNDPTAVVFSVPAVGQWNPPELAPFVERYMEGAECFVIADSDAHRNTQVMRHTIRCRRFLRDRDVDAHILLPPEGVLGKDKKGKDEKVGADDALGSLARRSLHDFMVIHREVDYNATITPAILETWTGLDATVRAEIPGRPTVRVQRLTLPNPTWRGRVRDL